MRSWYGLRWFCYIQVKGWYSIWFLNKSTPQPSATWSSVGLSFNGGTCVADPSPSVETVLSGRSWKWALVNELHISFPLLWSVTTDCSAVNRLHKDRLHAPGRPTRGFPLWLEGLCLVLRITFRLHLGDHVLSICTLIYVNHRVTRVVASIIDINTHTVYCLLRLPNTTPEYSLDMK